MSCHYLNDRLHLEQVELAAIAAEVGTPCYVYSRGAIEARYAAYAAACEGRAHRVCYAVKANANLSVIRTLGLCGAGFDIVSAGELERVLATGAPAADVVFSGVGKTAADLARALEAGVGCINVESEAELDRVSSAAREAGRRAAVAVRVNPDVDAGTHPYISTGLRENKFGVPIAEAAALYRRIAADEWLHAEGIACHIGSQLTSVAPVVEAVRQVVAMAEELRAGGLALAHVDVGGGLGIRYHDEQPPPIAALIAALLAEVPAHYTMVMEPGRSLVGPAGVLLTRVEYLKQTGARNFLIVDAAMNDLLRPALYGAWHEVLPCVRDAALEPLTVDVVGPVCESGDWLARERQLAARPGDLIALSDAGAYGMVMASNYNTRPRAAEVLVAGDAWQVVRARESIAALLADERARLIAE